MESDRFNIEVAATYLDDAIAGRNIPFIAKPNELKLYKLYKKPCMVVILYCTYVLYLSLALFEGPGSPVIPLPFWVTVIIEFICIGIFIGRFMHEMFFSSFNTFWMDKKHVTICVILVIAVIDIVTYTIVVETGNHFPRWSRPLRPFVIINFPDSRQVRQGFRNIRRTLPEIVNVLCLFFANTAIFSLMAFKLFGASKGIEKIDYFTDFFESFWDMYVLVTTANHPDIMMPAISKHRYYAIFFVFYLIINLYMFMSVFLAVVYNQFRCNLKNEVKESFERKEHLIHEVIRFAEDSQGSISLERYKELMSIALPNMDLNYKEAIWILLNPRNKPAIDTKTFMEILDILKFKYVDTSSRTNCFEAYFPNIYNSDPSRFLIHIVRHKRFRYFFDFAIVLNAICIGFNIEDSEHAFLTIFFLEIVLKMYAFGIKAFFQKLWNIFDVVVVGAALIVSIVHLADASILSESSVDFLMVLRVLRIFKVFHAFPRFSTVLNTLLSILPSVATYGCILFIIFYLFAILGMDLFHDKIKYDGSEYCGNIELKDSEFYRHNYCPNNFNNLLSSFIVLFELMVVNQWHVITEGYVLVTSVWARLYFLAFHLVCVIMILNIFTAFVLEAFILEFSVAKSGLKSNITDRIVSMGLALGVKVDKTNSSSAHSNENLLENDELDADHEELSTWQNLSVEKTEEEGETFPDASLRTPIRFKLGSKARSVQHLLERMFEKDLRDQI